MTIVFWIDGHEYTAPEWWMERQIEARKALGATFLQATTEAMTYWAQTNEKERSCTAHP